MSNSALQSQSSTWMPVPVESLPAPHFRYSPIVRCGSLLFVSGMVALDPETGGLLKGGLAAQTQRIFDNLENACIELGVERRQLMLVRVYCADFAEFGAFNAVWENNFKDQTPPARTSVGVSALPLGALIEMEFQFAIE